MARISIVKDDAISNHIVIVDGRAISFDLSLFIPDVTFYALQWFDTFGERENSDGTVLDVVDLTLYQPAIDEWASLAAAEDALLPTPFQQESRLKMTEIDVKAQQQLSSDLSVYSFWEFFLDYEDSIVQVVLEGSATANIITYRSIVDEADSWLIDNLTPTPLIDIAILESGESKSSFVTDILGFRDTANSSLVRIFSRRREYVRDLKASIDIADVNAIVVDYS